MLKKIIEKLKMNIKVEGRIRDHDLLSEVSGRIKNVYHSELVRSIQEYSFSIIKWYKYKDINKYTKRKYFKKEEEMKNLLSFPNEFAFDGYFGSKTWDMLQIIFLSLNDVYIGKLENEDVCMLINKRINSTMMEEYLAIATIKDLPTIDSLLRRLRSDLYKNEMNSCITDEKEKDNERKINRLRGFCFTDISKFVLVTKENGSTILELNGKEMPKTLNRSAEFNNGYIEGYRRAISMVKKIMKFDRRRRMHEGDKK